MKICWNNIENLYLTKRGNLKKSSNIFYESVCIGCGNNFLKRSNVIGYCTSSCAAKNSNKHNNPIKQVNELRQKIKTCSEYNYYDNPKYCVICGKILGYYKRNYDCCSHSCSNTNKWRDPEYNQRVSDKISNAKSGHYKHSELYNYRIDVKRFTRRNYKKYKNIINPKGLPLKKSKYNLDHKFSVYEGFINKIDPRIISSPYNLEVISEEDNIKKGIECSIGIKELLTENEMFGRK